MGLRYIYCQSSMIDQSEGRLIISDLDFKINCLLSICSGLFKNQACAVMGSVVAERSRRILAASDKAVQGGMVKGGGGGGVER